MPSLHTNRGAKAARAARARFGVAPDEPLDCLLTVVEKRAGVPVTLIPLPAGFAGAYLARGGRALIFLAVDGPVARRRFSLAHELGHHCLRHPRHADTWEGMRIGDRHPHETQANAFAAEFLAPKAGILRSLEESGNHQIALDIVVRLAARFGISCEAMRYRLWTCRVLKSQSLADKLDEELRADEHVRLAEQLGITWPEDRLAELHGAPLRVPDGFEAAIDAIAALLDGR
jgi:Zn-dependent peptidase ImmA (M78 family)